MEKLHQFRDFLQRSDIEPLFKSLSVSQTNWGELQTEILQVIGSAGPRHVREALIQASTKLLSTEVRGASEPTSASAASQSILQGLKRATDVISSLSKREVLSMGRESQKVLIQALSHLADEDSMAQFLTIDVLRDKVPIDVQSGKRTNEDELEQLARHLLTRGGLMNHLLLLLFLWQSAESSLDVQYFRVVLGLIAQPNRSLLSLPELELFGSVIKSQESTKLCEGTPRVHIFCGSPSKINRYDFQGQAAASVLGFNSASTVDQQFVYFEFSVKSKGGSLSNVRVGWGSTKTYFRHPLMNGCDDSHWMMDFGTQQIHYNEATANDDSPSAYDIGNLFGNDDDDNDEPSAISAAAITSTAAAVETANTAEADIVQYLERRDSGKVKWDSGIISCVYSFAESSSLFFINGEYVGRFKTQPVWSEDKKDISPIFVGSETSVFDINLGQQPYQYLSQVTTYMDSEHFLSSQSSHHAAAEVVRNAEANFKAYKYLSMGQADEVGYFDVNDVSSESLKTLTLEVSLRLPSNYTGLDQVVVQTSPTPDALVSDGSLTVGISSQLGVFFEIAGCGGKVVTPKESVPCNSWFHVAVAVSYSKSGGKLQVHIYINGQSAAHGELIPEKNPKAFKMPIKHMQVGSPFEKDRDHSFVGDLCNVRVWGNARGGEKITSLMHKSKLSGSESDLLLFFPCDEGIGLEVHDCSNAKPGGKRHNRIYLQGDVVWGSMSSAHFDSALASIQSGWAFLENDGTDVIDLASTLLDRVKIIQEKGADYLAKGWSSAEFSGCGLALSDFLLDFDGQSLELLKCLMVYVLRRAATGVETKMQTSFEKFLPVALSILERSLTFFVRQSPSPLSETLRESLFMVLLFLVNGCSFLSDAISMQLTTSARSILVSSIELFFPEPVERAEVLHSILEAKLKAADLARPLALRRSSSMDGAHNVQVFIKQDFAIALSSLKPEVRDFVLDVFLDNVRKVTTLDALVAADSKPKTLVIGNGAASVKDITKNMKSKPTKRVEHGSFVRRGRDWIYGDEGGSGVGIVLAITKWKEQSHSAAIVLWENNHIGKYRLGYSVASAEGVSELFDVELLYDDAVATAEANVGVSANAAVDTTTDASTTPHGRNPFSGTVFTVANVARNLLSLPDSSLSISKRSTLSFIKDMAEESWLEERGLLDSVNVLVNNFDEMDVFYFFVDFYQRYGPSSTTAAPSRASPGKLTPKELLLSMVQKLAQSVVLDVESNSERMVASVDALSALSGMVFGALSIEQGKSPRDSHVLTKYNVDTFGNTETSSGPWSWTEGLGREATETAKDKAAKKTTTKVVEHVLDNFPIIRVPGNIQTRQRGKGLEVSVHDVREWSTLVFDTPMLPNSGIYRWFMKVKFSERRGQILLGFCTEKSSPTVQLGVSDESWGVSPNVDVYHGNQKRSVNLSTSKKISSGSILEFCVDTYEGTFSFTELSSGLVSRFGGKDYDVCRNPKLRQEILFPAISLSNPGDSVLLVGDAGDLKMLQSRMGSSDDRSASTTDDKGTPSTVILGCPTPVAMEVFRTNVDCLTKLWERSLPEIETLTALSLQVGLPLLITLSAMCKWGHVAVEDRTAVSKESLSFLKLGLALLRQLDLHVNDAATAAAREGHPSSSSSSSSLREWRSLTLQLVALVVELVGKVIVEAARAPALGSSFNEYLDIGGAVRIESSYAMKSAYSRSLGSDLFVHGWNESPMTLQPTTVVTTWLQTLLGDFSLENCDEVVALFVQILLFHIGREGLMHKAVDTAHEEHAGIVAVVAEQVKSFVRQYAALPEAKRSFAAERLLLATKCVRSPNQASIVVDGDDSDLALSSILTGLSEEIVAFVFSEYVYAAVIESLLADREYQANTKATAFEQAKTILLLLEDETVQAIKTMFLDQLAAGLNGPYEVFSGILKENTSSTSWHYFDGLNGASVQAGKKLRASFASFMSYLIAELTSLAEIGSERTVLAVLGTLATKVIIFDHESLARSRFFAALEEIINADAADASSSSKDADDLSGQVVTVATKLFIMMALQVASGGKRSVKDRSLPSPSIQRAVSLERMRSGPATLNKTVFDLVQRLLRRAIDRLPTSSPSSSSSPSSRKAPDSLFECVTILLNVAIDEETRKVIATPEWFSLLLELVFAADGKYRHRSFAVLAELLPGMGSIANSDWNKLRSLDGHVGSAFPWDHCSGKSLPLTMILHIIGTFASIPFTLHRECPFLEDGGKLVDQYQSWMAVVTEGVNLYRSLLVSHEAWKTDAMNALVAALGEGDSVGAAGSVPSLVLGALAVFDGYFVCTHQYSMVACPLSGETFIGVITGYMDSSRERVEASGVLVGPDTLHAKYDRKQDMKKMVAAASVLMPIHKTLTSSLPINVRLVQAAMKCFERFERLHTPSTSSVRTNGEPKAETKEEEDGGRLQESKDEEATASLPPPSSSFSLATNDGSDGGGAQAPVVVSAELLEYFRTIFHKFFLAIVTHPAFSTLQLWEITATSEFQFFWSKTMDIASTTCRSSDLGVFNNLEEHFHDLAVLLGTKQLQNQSKDAAAGHGGATAASSSSDAKSAAATEPAMTAAASAANPTTLTPASAPRSPNTLGLPSELVESLTIMGFPRASCIAALERTGGDFEEALNILLSEATDEGYDMAQEDEEEAAHHHVHEPPSSGASASEAKTMEDTSPTNDGDGDGGDAEEGDEDEDHGDDEEDEDEDDGGDSHHHYRQEPAGRALPFHVAPDFASERIGCLFPGDDIHVIEERVVDGVKWLSFHMADFDNSNYSSTYGDDFFQYLVWAPTVVNGTTVIFDGVFQHDMETEFTDVVFEPASMDRCYRVIGSKGALVRVGIEIGTDEQAMLEPGTVVHAFEESFNAEGTVRIHIDQPVRGWMSKLIGLVERVPDTVMPSVTASSAAPSVAATKARLLTSEYDLQIDDNLDGLSGHDIFTKEDRFFANMQGRRFDFLERADGARLLGGAGRRRKLTLPSATSASVSEVQQLLMKTVGDVGGLTARKCLLLLVSRWAAEQPPAQAQQATSPRLAPVAWTQSPACAETLLKCLRLLLFRGDVNYLDGYQRFLFHGGDFLHVLKQPVSVEDALLVIADKIVTGGVFVVPDEVQGRFREMFLDAIQKNLKQACEARYSDHSWEDTAQEASSDSELLSSPSVNYALWLTLILARSPHDEETLMKLIITWVQTVKAASMSLKCIAYRMSVHLLDVSRALSPASRDVVRLHTQKIISLRRLSSFAVKRLWQEMEDAPQYSRFMQALTALLFQLTDVFSNKASSLSRAPSVTVTGTTATTLTTTPATPAAEASSSSQCVRFKRYESHLQFTSQKDLSAPWSLRVRLCRRHFVPEQYEPYVRSEKDGHGGGNGSGKAAGHRLGRDHKLQDMIKLLTGEGMDERETTKGRVTPAPGGSTSSSSSAAAETKTTTTKATPLSEFYLNPSYLLLSSRAFVKIQKGGRTFVNQVLEDPADVAAAAADGVEVFDEALCVSVGQSSSEERSFNVVIPYDRWVDLVLVCDQAGGITSLYLDGQLQESMPFTFNLPLTTVGSSKAGYSFAGDMSHFQVWNYAKSAMEVSKDFAAMAQGHVTNKPLIHVVYSADSVDGLFDEMGMVTGMKAHDCTFVDADDTTGGPSLSPLAASANDKASATFLVTTDNIDTSADAVELTGYIRVPKSGKKPPLSSGIEDIVVLRYQLLDTTTTTAGGGADAAAEEHVVEMHGTLTWSEKQVKMRLHGTYHRVTHVFTLHGHGSDVVSGPPEKISWLRCLTLQGSIRDGVFDGDCFLDLKLEVSPSQPLGTVRLDMASLPAAVEAVANDERVFSTVKVKADSTDGQYVAYFTVQPYRLGEYLSYGLMKGQGSVWIDWQIKASSGNIAFGWTTHSALSHPDASVDVNRGTWTYSTSGQASHGDDLYLCDSADEGDVVSLQLNTNTGHLRVFKNYELILAFEHVCDDGLLTVHDHELGEVGKRGIRPFVSVVSPDDCVQLLGAKEGPVDLTFPETDAFARCKLIGRVVRGAIEGVALVSKETNSRWEFGPWTNDCANGVHIEIGDIRAETIDVVAVRRYVQDTEDVSVPADELAVAVGSADVQRLVEQFYEFRREHAQRGCSLFARAEESLDEGNSSSTATQAAVETTETMTSHDETPAVTSDDVAATPQITVSVCAHAPDVVTLTVPLQGTLHAMMEAFAARNSAYAQAFQFKLGDTVLSAEDTAEAAGLTDGCAISAVTRSFTYEDTVDDPVTKYFPSSTAPYIVMIIYEGGATVRDRIEIDDNSRSLRIIRRGEIVEAFQKSMTSDGIGRFKIADGWISERLRGGTEEPVVRILKQRFEVTGPLTTGDLPQYRILRDEGAKLRAEAAFTSDDIGLCPQYTVVSVDEKRMVRNEAESNAWTSRLHVLEPSAHSGWISEKDKLIEKLTDGAFAGVDAAIQMEIARRNKLRASKPSWPLLFGRSTTTTTTTTNTQSQLLRLKAEVSLSAEVPFLLRKSRHCENVHVSKDFTTVTCPENCSGRQVILGSKGFSHGVHYWEVHVKSANWGTVFIGVAPEDASGWNGMGFINYRATQAFGSETLYGNYYGVNDKIGVLLDMDRGTLTFFKDGEDFNVGRVTVVNMGVAYRHVRKSAGRHSSSPMLYPCFGVKTPGDSLSIKDTHWMSYSGVDSTQTMQRALQALSFVQAWKAAYASSVLQVSNAAVQAMYDDYGHKCSPHFFTTDARPGLPVQLLVSHEALTTAVGEALVQEYGLHVGCNLTTVYGPASLLGVSSWPHGAGWRVWYSCEKNGKRAWYWTVAELREALSARTVEVLSELLIPISHRQESFNAIDRDSRLSQEAFVQLVTASVLASPTASPAATTEGSSPTVLDDTVAPWTYDEDCALVDAVNKVAIRHDHDAASLSAHMVQRYLEQQHLLTDRSATEIHVRYTALCLLNRCLAIVLPLLDLSMADVHRSLLIVNTSSSSAAAAGAAAGGAQWRPGCSLLAVPSPLRDLVLSMKHIIFTQTKQQVWSLAVKETTVATALPADEYERPDEIREITVNSLKGKHYRSGLPPLVKQFDEQEKMFERWAHQQPAATGTATSATLLSEWVKEIDERIRVSVFGQLLDAFSTWDDRVLRKAYVHMQDAGQARAFFVKLAGEGVDDQGGPYRAVFQTAIGEDVTHLLPLLVPSDNQAQGVGADRDRFVFNLSLLSHHPRGVSLLQHLGKLVGVAVRHRIQVPLPLASCLFQALCFEVVSVREAMLASQAPLVHSLKALVDMVSDTDGAVFSLDEREEAADFLAEALVKSVKRLQTTSRAVWSTLVTSAIGGGSSSSGSSSGSGGGSNSSSAAGASLASFAMSLSDVSEHTLRAMVFATLQLPVPATATPTATASSASTASMVHSDRFASVTEIVDTICAFHLLAQNEALQLFFKGLSQVLPTELCALFTAEELESVISGAQEVDFDVLQQATVYEGVAATDPHIELFWDAVRSLDTEEQALFVNFCSGRSRLPASASDFPMPFKLTAPPATSTEQPDRFLPVARTCFFSLSLPKYSSLDICREKLRYAIRHTEVMDADFVDRRGATAWDALPTAPVTVAAAVNNDAADGAQENPTGAAESASTSAST